jgi:hypothetical protein
LPRTANKPRDEASGKAESNDEELKSKSLFAIPSNLHPYYFINERRLLLGDYLVL